MNSHRTGPQRPKISKDPATSAKLSIEVETKADGNVKKPLYTIRKNSKSAPVDRLKLGLKYRVRSPTIRRPATYSGPRKSRRAGSRLKSKLERTAKKRKSPPKSGIIQEQQKQQVSSIKDKISLLLQIDEAIKQKQLQQSISLLDIGNDEDDGDSKDDYDPDEEMMAKVAHQQKPIWKREKHSKHQMQQHKPKTDNGYEDDDYDDDDDDDQNDKDEDDEDKWWQELINKSAVERNLQYFTQDTTSGLINWQPFRQPWSLDRQNRFTSPNGKNNETNITWIVSSGSPEPSSQIASPSKDEPIKNEAKNGTNNNITTRLSYPSGPVRVKSPSIYYKQSEKSITTVEDDLSSPDKMVTKDLAHLPKSQTDPSSAIVPIASHKNNNLVEFKKKFWREKSRKSKKRKRPATSC